ncbi:MAG: NAD-dependent DNA ligase LigA [Tissierellia bacterium]|nr:NAD-dependent DNA ligase LigA [Tissierellia bacterium]
MSRIDELKKRINELNYHYYTLDEPLVSDAEYDALYDELVKLEEERGYKDPDSPTTRVGAEILSKFEKHDHIAPLMSLDKAQSIQEIENWIIRTNKLIDEYNSNSDDKLPEPEYVLEYKFDGLTINLTYDDGNLVNAATRGNGITGEEILLQVKTINSIPLSIEFKGLMEVQGEGVMPLSKLEEYNKTADIALKNARNAAAGALRNLDPAVTASRNLDAYFYSIGYIDESQFGTQEEMLEFLSENRFKVSSFRPLMNNIEEIKNEIETVGETRKNLDVLTDGIVIKINDLRTREILGHTNRAPRWAIAYKFEAEEFTTILEEVIWNVGRTGKVTPSAILDPVEIGGATIRRATLNNYDDIERKQLRLGARVLIRRSNDVIPEILGIVPDPDVETTEIEKPDHCPYCHSELVQNGVHIFCPNSISCRPQMISRLTHFASRDAMDIEGLSEKTVSKLLAELGVKSLTDIYEVKKEDLLKLEGFKDKRADNLLNAIENSKDVKLSSFIYALGIPNVGIKTAMDLVDRFETLENIKNASEEELTEVPDIGDIVAASIHEFFHDEEIISGLDDLINHGIKFEEVDKKEDSAIKDKRFVITGSFENYKRKDLEEILISKGAKVSSSVSKNTDYLLVGKDPGSKLTKGESLGVSIIRESELDDFIENMVN